MTALDAFNHLLSELSQNGGIQEKVYDTLVLDPFYRGIAYAFFERGWDYFEKGLEVFQKQTEPKAVNFSAFPVDVQIAIEFRKRFVNFKAVEECEESLKNIPDPKSEEFRDAFMSGFMFCLSRLKQPL